MTGAKHSPFEGATGDDLALTTLADALAAVLRQRGLGAAVVLAKITAAFETAAGPELASQVRPIALRSGELICEVPDPAFATQVRLLSATLLDRIAVEVGFPVATRLSVRVSRRSEA